MLSQAISWSEMGKQNIQANLKRPIFGDFRLNRFWYGRSLSGKF